MAKSSYLFKLLYVAALCVCSYAGSPNVTRKEQGHRVPVSLTAYPSVKSLYDREIGVKETGRNSGKRVEEYLSYVGLKKGQPWCAAFVCWVYGQAGINNPKTGSAAVLMTADKTIWKYNALNRHANLPQSGDVFGIWFQSLRRVAHVGFVDQWKGNWLVSVEGNSNNTGGREGDGVYRKRRLVKGIYAVARYN